MLGDNNYGAGTPEQYALRFERRSMAGRLGGWKRSREISRT
jgi:hypothetical protein